MVSLAFRIAFGVCSIDLFMHGPVKEQKIKCLPLIFACFAIATDEYLAYNVSLLAWLGCMLYDLYTEEEKAQEQVQAVAEPEVEGEPQVPESITKLLADAVEKFHANCGKVNCEGKEWKPCKETKDTRVENSSYSGLSIKRWRATTEIEGTRESIVSELFDYTRRLEWDPSLRCGERLETFPGGDLGDKILLSRYETAPAAGGAVSSRELVDVGVMKNTDDGGLFFVNVSVGDKEIKLLPSIPKTKSDPIRAFTHPGSGIKLTPVPDSKNEQGEYTKFTCTLVSNIQLNGWLMQSIVNSATTSALVDSTTLMKQHLYETAKKN